MYRISELAQRVGLSRSTLLYYEKLGLIAGKRQSNGYRRYSKKDLERIKLLQQLQAGGLTLKECQSCLEGKINRSTLKQRLNILDTEIKEKHNARELLSSMLGMSSMRQWHERIEESAPSAHLDWLMKQGFSEKNALRLKWLSKDMNQHEQYMADFEFIFQGLDRLGPGDNKDTLQALFALPMRSGHALEVGCGKGVTTTLLADKSNFTLTALDNDEYNLHCLKDKIKNKAYEHRITTACSSMTSMPFNKGQFDVLWAEGSAYIMGVSHALRTWKPFLKRNGYVVISDLVWLTHSPDEKAKAFWKQNYPDMTTSEQRAKEMVAAGYEVIKSFTQSEQSWHNYLKPLRKKIEQLEDKDIASTALIDLQTELQIHDKYLGQYGYHVFVLKNKG